MELILKYFPDLTALQIDRFEKLYNLYHYWNEKINVISRKDIGYLYERHILHSLSIAMAFQFNAGISILDVGTGGGLPGIPLAIYFQDCHFMLIDSIRKKINVVNSINRELKLENVRTLQTRVENHHARYDFVVARAVTGLNRFTGWVLKNIRNNPHPSVAKGIIYLKGGDVEEEIVNPDNFRIIPISNYFSESFFETKKIIYIPL